MVEDAVFKGRHFDRSVILLCIRWYLAYNLSLRNLGVQSRHLVDWIEPEAFWLSCPDFADVLVGGEALQGLQTPARL